MWAWNGSGRALMVIIFIQMVRKLSTRGFLSHFNSFDESQKNSKSGRRTLISSSPYDCWTWRYAAGIKWRSDPERIRWHLTTFMNSYCDIFQRIPLSDIGNIVIGSQWNENFTLLWKRSGTTIFLHLSSFCPNASAHLRLLWIKKLQQPQGL